MGFSENFISFEKAKLLKEKGIIIPSMFLYYADSESSEPFFIIYTDIGNYNSDNLYNAYLSSEVINMMPLNVSNGPLKIIRSISGNFRYIAMYTQRWIRHGNRLPDTLVDLLEFLLEKGKVTLKDINHVG